MTDTPHNMLAEIGHNSGATPAEIAADEVAAAVAMFKERRDALIADADKRAVTDNDSIGRAADVRSMIRTLRETIEIRAKEIAAPYAQASSTVKRHFENFVVDLDAADARIDQRVRDCREDQRAKAAKQAKEQADAEAALRAKHSMPAAAPMPDAPISLPTVKGDYGSAVGDRTVKVFTYKDPKKLPMDVLKAAGVEKAIQQALRDYHKIHKTIPGVTITTEKTTSHRRPN